MSNILIYEYFYAAPSEPTNVTLTPIGNQSTSDSDGNFGLLVQWAAPTSPNGRILSYLLQWNSVYSAQNDIVNATVNKTEFYGYTVTGLSGCTHYTVSVTARNGFGLGNHSSKSLQMPPAGIFSVTMYSVYTQYVPLRIRVCEKVFVLDFTRRETLMARKVS